MAEFKKGKMSWDWKSIESFANIAKQIHKESPQSDVEIKGLIRLFASYAEDHLAYDEDPIRPLVDVMIETVFDEE